MNNFKIADKKIGQGQPVLIVAEISANHLQKLERAKKIVEEACRAGAGAVKLQHYKPETMTLDSSKSYFQIKDHPLWKGRTLFDLYKKSYMPWEWYEKLKIITDKYGVLLFSTVYDDSAIDFLEKRDCPAYKIGAFELTDFELLKKAAKTKKPVILSRGMSTLEELEQALNVLEKNGSEDIAVLHCVSAYPTTNYKEMNLLTIPDLKRRFNVVVGLSEHTLTNAVSVASVALGAKIIERHFTLKRADGGPDVEFSLEPEEMKRLVEEVRQAEQSLGKPFYEIGTEEKKTVLFKRSLWVVNPVKKEEEFTRENIGRFRPGHGLPVRYLSQVLGRKAKEDIPANVPLKMSHLKDNLGLELRRAELFDSKGIWLIRNHPQIRKNSLNPAIIPFNEHSKWFKNYLKNKDNVCYILKKDKKIMGYCRFVQKEDKKIVSIAVNPEFQSHGLGSYLLKNSVKKLENKDNIWAVVKSDNKISLLFFKKNNFKVVKKDKNNYYLKFRPIAK